MFTVEFVESHQKEIVIRDIEERAMELLVNFAYTAQITVEESNVQSLLPAACLLQMAEIQGNGIFVGDNFDLIQISICSCTTCKALHIYIYIYWLCTQQLT